MTPEATIRGLRWLLIIEGTILIILQARILVAFEDLRPDIEQISKTADGIDKLLRKFNLL